MRRKDVVSQSAVSSSIITIVRETDVFLLDSPSRNLARAGSRDDGHEVAGVEYVGDITEDDRYGKLKQMKRTLLSKCTMYANHFSLDMEWKTRDVNKSLWIEEEVVSRLERHLSNLEVHQKSSPKKHRRPALKGQSQRDLEEYEELFAHDERDLAHLRPKRGRKKNGRKKKGKNKKKGKRGKKNKKKNKKQGGRPNRPNNNGGVYDFGDQGVVGNTQHNNLFDDKNRRAVCLKPEDPYRTCYSRTDDPNSKLNKDYIDRSGYNFGIKLYKQSYTYVDPASIDPAYNTPLEPYTKPYTKSTERLVTDLIWLTLLQDDTKVDCDAQIAMEEATLKYLKGKIGGPNTFEPVCVFVKDSVYKKEKLLDGSGDDVESTVLALEITYVMKDSWIKKNQNNKCKPKDRAQCSSQVAMNSEIGKYCKRVVSIYDFGSM